MIHIANLGQLLYRFQKVCTLETHIYTNAMRIEMIPHGIRVN